MLKFYLLPLLCAIGSVSCRAEKNGVYQETVNIDELVLPLVYSSSNIVSSYYGARLLARYPTVQDIKNTRRARNLVNEPSPYLIPGNQEFGTNEEYSGFNQFQNGSPLPQSYVTPVDHPEINLVDQQSYNINPNNPSDQQLIPNYVFDNGQQSTDNQYDQSQQYQFGNIIGGDLSNIHSFGSYLSSPADIHTDVGSSNGFGLTLLSNEGLNNRHPSSAHPFDTSIDNTFTFSQSETDLLLQNNSPQVNDEGFIINPQPSFDQGFINDGSFNAGGTNFDNSVIFTSENDGGFSNLQPEQSFSNIESSPSFSNFDDDSGISLSQANSAGSSGIADDLTSILSNIGNVNNGGTNLDLLGGLTIGQLLMGINGQNGVMVVPTSSFIDNPEIGDILNDLNFGNDDLLSSSQNDDIIVISPTTAEPETFTSRSSRRTTTRAPDHIRKSLSDLWYSKGQWFGTILGGMIDFGKIAVEAFKNHSKTSTATDYLNTRSSSNTDDIDIFSLI